MAVVTPAQLENKIRQVRWLPLGVPLGEEGEAQGGGTHWTWIDGSRSSAPSSSRPSTSRTAAAASSASLWCTAALTVRPRCWVRSLSGASDGTGLREHRPVAAGAPAPRERVPQGGDDAHPRAADEDVDARAVRAEDAAAGARRAVRRRELAACPALPPRLSMPCSSAAACPPFPAFEVNSNQLASP